jgi:hypothetical protein
LSSTVVGVVPPVPPGAVGAVTAPSPTLGVDEEPGVVVTVTLGWDASVVSAELDVELSSELDGVVTDELVVVEG